MCKNHYSSLFDTIKFSSASYKIRCEFTARRIRAKFWPDCAIPDTSMKFGTVVDHD